MDEKAELPLHLMYVLDSHELFMGRGLSTDFVPRTTVRRIPYRDYDSARVTLQEHIGLGRLVRSLNQFRDHPDVVNVSDNDRELHRAMGPYRTWMFYYYRMSGHIREIRTHLDFARRFPFAVWSRTRTYHEPDDLGERIPYKYFGPDFPRLGKQYHTMKLSFRAARLKIDGETLAWARPSDTHPKKEDEGMNTRVRLFRAEEGQPYEANGIQMVLSTVAGADLHTVLKDLEAGDIILWQDWYLMYRGEDVWQHLLPTDVRVQGLYSKSVRQEQGLTQAH